MNFFFFRFTVHFGIYKVRTPTNALFIKLYKVLKLTLNITVTCSYMSTCLRPSLGSLH
jgi:hypothetical protein